MSRKVEDMIKEALQYIVGLGETQTRIHRVTLSDGEEEVYYTGDLERIPRYRPKAETITMRTLTGLVDYIKGHIDTMAERMVVHVTSPEEVVLFSQLDKDRKREYLAKAYARVPEFTYGRFIAHEEFCIAIQSKFMSDPETDKDLILQFAGTVENGTIAEYGDTGVSQKATVRTGVASKSDKIVPNPVKLRPFRTFLEVEQPVSEFVFRMDDKNGIACALFEADGGAWKNAAAKSIKDYLEFELADYKEQFTVIS